MDFKFVFGIEVAGCWWANQISWCPDKWSQPLDRELRSKVVGSIAKNIQGTLCMLLGEPRGVTESFLLVLWVFTNSCEEPVHLFVSRGDGHLGDVLPPNDICLTFLQIPSKTFRECLKYVSKIHEFEMRLIRWPYLSWELVNSVLLLFNCQLRIAVRRGVEDAS